MTIIVVTGIPASGKTTLAKSLGQQLGISVISKDVIKEALMDVLGTGDIDWANALSKASHKVMYQLIDDLAGDVILEAHFHHGVAEPELVSLGETLIQLHCVCPVDIAWNRYKTRRDDALRHPGHLPEHQDDKATMGWRTSKPQPLTLDAPLISVDTSGFVDLDSIARQIREHLSS